MSRIPSPWKEWLPAAFWLGIIVLESTGLASSANTSRILYPLFHFLFNVSLQAFLPWNHLFRKIGHFVGYGLLSVLLFRAWRATFPMPNLYGWTLRWSRTALLMTALVASLDEWHQSYLPSRTGRWQDVVLDSSAALCLQFTIWVILRMRNRPYSRPENS